MSNLTLSRYHEQQLLDLFIRTFETDPEILNPIIQGVKAALYDRDYPTAFGTLQNLEAYVARWTPSRALAYAHLFSNLVESALYAPSSSNNNNSNAEDNKTKRILSIGGGAGAEIVGFGALALLNHCGNRDHKLHVTAVDVAEWDPVVAKISDYMNRNWAHNSGDNSNDTSRSLDEHLANLSLIDTDEIKVDFINHDILTLPRDRLDFSKLDLITSMFTTNELFTASRTGTVKFLKSLVECRKGTLLLFVESAGSYSEVMVGTKKFPVHFLINHVLSHDNTWELLSSADSKWYRLPAGLSYPMQLENMRYFYRLYRRT
jgi:25S rRNA (uracil2843-N3)-methyltransferase